MWYYTVHTPIMGKPEKIAKYAEKANGIEENTVVIFMSDNGGLSTGSGKRMPTSEHPMTETEFLWHI